MSSLALWSAYKTVKLTGQRRHIHKGAKMAPGFAAPDLAPQIRFGATALAAAIARTATLRDAPPELLAYWRDSALSDARIMLADGPTFELSPLLASLADSERTHFASRFGAGITDLYMNALGYTWRDNAASLAASLEPHGDFLYDGGPAFGHGVVLAEAHGSFAAKVSDAAMASAAERKYLRQVRPYIGATSIHGQVVHGYSVAFGSRPDAPGAFLRLSQTRRSKSKAGSLPTSAPASTSPVLGTMALASHRSNFILMDALPVADWIDWIGGVRDFPENAEPIVFARFNYAGRSFLVSVDSLAPYLWWNELHVHPYWHHRLERRYADSLLPLQWFVIEEKAGTAFLNALTGMIRSGPRRELDTLELPTGDIAGFANAGPDDVDRSAREDYDYALFRDGLALIGGPPPRKLRGFMTWHPKEGMLE